MLLKVLLRMTFDIKNVINIYYYVNDHLFCCLFTLCISTVMTEKYLAQDSIVCKYELIDDLLFKLQFRCLPNPNPRS